MVDRSKLQTEICIIINDYVRDTKSHLEIVEYVGNDDDDEDNAKNKKLL